jgi:hypothetical protein
MGFTSIRRFRQIQVDKGDLKPDKHDVNNEKNLEPMDVPNQKEAAEKKKVVKK